MIKEVNVVSAIFNNFKTVKP